MLVYGTVMWEMAALNVGDNPFCSQTTETKAETEGQERTR